MSWLIFLVFISHTSWAAEYKEPQEAFSELWLDNTDPGEVDQLGDLTVFRLGIRRLLIFLLLLSTQIWASNQ